MRKLFRLFPAGVPDVRVGTSWTAVDPAVMLEHPRGRKRETRAMHLYHPPARRRCLCQRQGCSRKRRSAHPIGTPGSCPGTHGRNSPPGRSRRPNAGRRSGAYPQRSPPAQGHEARSQAMPPAGKRAKWRIPDVMASSNQWTSKPHPLRITRETISPMRLAAKVNRVAVLPHSADWQ